MKRISLLDNIKKTFEKESEKTNVYDATRAIIKKLDGQGMRYEVKHYDAVENSHCEHDWIKLNLKSENISSVSVELFIFENGELGVKTYYLCRAKEDKIVAVLKLINELNQEYRYVKFTIDSDNNVGAEADSELVLNDVDFDSRTINFIADFVDVLDEAYPRIMEEVWKG